MHQKLLLSIKKWLKQVAPEPPPLPENVAIPTNGHLAALSVYSKFFIALIFFFWIAVAYKVFTIPLERTLQIVPDDLFYYLKIVNNTAKTGHYTFDGINPTTGFHPLWLWLLISLKLVAEFCHFQINKEALIHLAQTVSLFFHCASAMVIFLYLRMACKIRIVPVIFSVAWILNGYLISVSIMALESSMYVFFINLFLGQTTLWFFNFGSARHSKNLKWIGLTAAGAMLSRTEFTLILPWFAITFLFALLIERQPLSKIIVTIMNIFAPPILALIFWMITCYIVTGSALQDSGAMKRFWAEGYAGALTTFSPKAWWHCLFDYFDFLTRFFYIKNKLSFWLSTFPLAALLASSGLFIYNFKRNKSKSISFILGITIPFSSLFTVYIYNRFFCCIDYWGRISSFVLVFWSFIFIVLLFYNFYNGNKQQFRLISRTILICIGCIMLVSLPMNLYKTPTPIWPHQQDVFTSLVKVEKHLQKGALLGIFNAGIPAYFHSNNVTVINLDGLVNHSVIKYWKENHFSDYLYDTRIEYISDEGNSIGHGNDYSKTPLKLLNIEEYPLTGSPPIRYLYHVENKN